MCQCGACAARQDGGVTRLKNAASCESTMRSAYPSATIGMDRFGMEHVLPDNARVATVLALLAEGYADRMVLSHDAAFFSRVTPPSWRAAHAPHWHMENLHRRILPRLREGGASDADLHRMLVLNPARLLAPSTEGSP